MQHASQPATRRAAVLAGYCVIIAGSLVAVGACGRSEPSGADRLEMTRKSILWQRDKAVAAGGNWPGGAAIVAQMESAAQALEGKRRLDTALLIWSDLGLHDGVKAGSTGVVCLNWVEGQMATVRRQRQWHNQALGASEVFSVRSGSFGLGVPLFRRRRRASVFSLSSRRRVKMPSRRP